ncbi:hypothetical protein [Corynebacterium silvaticum]|uniref:Uncharacterized protein n=1 Tax=Corynebacterium silvaticum TaxID=2320431 RepID=A0A7Y4LHF0_9CORY|nr:hypothetical protein [Corynebacterium silvaticum]ARU46814.1 hypothetical protein CBE74_10555 [Corynebacterium silvaticum]MBH5300793.1 hypothetical protein [Corynebacterium silvaticum]NOM64990.1 hypothetical protein [Corynebacterium silvaticum]NON70129.1 hypothetical protein [Corynebacterium silvaticum]TFA91847.1 hypothetical protein EU802_08785 [Corynebacterium silvaticum]
MGSLETFLLNVGADQELINFLHGKGTGLLSRAINLLASFFGEGFTRARAFFQAVFNLDSASTEGLGSGVHGLSYTKQADTKQ